MTSHLYQAIHRQPQAIRELLSDWEKPSQAATLLANTSRILLVGTGTSFHAATIGEYMLRSIGVDAWAIRAFEFVSYPRPLRPNDGVIVLSHRGNKVYGNRTIQRAKEAQIVTVGITGKQSKLPDVDVRLETIEQDASSTHSISYIGTLTRLAQLAIRLAQQQGNDAAAQRLEQGLGQVPPLMEGIIAREDEVQAIAAEAVKQQRRLYMVGAGPNAVTAPEGALKAKEAAYVTTEGFELEQAIHGPMVAFETEDVVIPISVQGAAQGRMADFLRTLDAIGSRVWLIGETPDAASQALFSREGWGQFSLYEQRELAEELTPLLTVVPLQLLANFLAEARGTNADSFRGEIAQYKQAVTSIVL